MYEADLDLLRCPRTMQPLRIVSVASRGDDGEIIEGILSSGDRDYRVTNGIPRFIDDISYNASWDYKWRVLDGGQGLNYRIIDKNDPAYQIHDLFDRNSHGGMAYRRAQGGVALDIGCGIGQYSVRLLTEQNPRKVVAMDLTGGVDLMRKIVAERYPELRSRLLLVQASVFDLPFADQTFDFVMSLGVLMHTGQTLNALDRACRLVRPEGELNVWIYASEPLAYDAVEAGRERALTVLNVDASLRRWRRMIRQIHLFRRVSNETSVRLLRILSSDFVYGLWRKPRFQWVRKLFDGVDHPDFAYRLINNYDGWVNNWCDTWNESELFPVLRRNSIALLGMSDWRVGLWGRCIPGFYPAAAPAFAAEMPNADASA